MDSGLCLDNFQVGKQASPSMRTVGGKGKKKTKFFFNVLKKIYKSFQNSKKKNTFFETSMHTVSVITKNPSKVTSPDRLSL
jgi:hypothetical protein